MNAEQLPAIVDLAVQMGLDQVTAHLAVQVRGRALSAMLATKLHAVRAEAQSIAARSGLEFQCSTLAEVRSIG